MSPAVQHPVYDRLLRSLFDQSPLLGDRRGMGRVRVGVGGLVWLEFA